MMSASPTKNEKDDVEQSNINGFNYYKAVLLQSNINGGKGDKVPQSNIDGRNDDVEQFNINGGNDDKVVR